MELKPGYKQTEVGVIPEDWDALQLDDVCMMKSGEGITASSIDNFSDYPCYGGNGLRGYTRRYTHDGSFALIGRQGALCGNVVSAKGKFFASEHAVVVTPRAGYDIGYLTFVLGEMHLNRYSESSAQPGLSVTKLLRLPLAVPRTQAEQSTIAASLSNVVSLLGELEKLITKKRDIKQAAMQELLTGKRRLPGFEGEWEEFSLGSVASMNSGGTPPTGRDDYYGGGIPWVSISDMTSGGKSISQTERTLSTAGLASCAAKQFPAGTVLYAMYASLGECSIAATEVTSSQAILGIRPGASLHNEFLFYYLSSIHDKVKLMGQQGTQSNLNKGIVQGFILRLPGKAEQIAIAEALGEIDQELDALSMKAQKIRDMKAGMMQQLLTGKIRLA